MNCSWRTARTERRRIPLPDVKMEVKIDTAEIDEVMQKLQRLYELLKEANSLARELASMELKLDIKL